MQKTFMILLPIVCFSIYIIYLLKENIYKNIKILFSILLIFSWIIKNILVSGCVIFPISLSCLENLSYVNIEEIKNLKFPESWSKDWPNRADKNIKMVNLTRL